MFKQVNYRPTDNYRQFFKSTHTHTHTEITLADDDRPPPQTTLGPDALRDTL